MDLDRYIRELQVQGEEVAQRYTAEAVGVAVRYSARRGLRRESGRGRPRGLGSAGGRRVRRAARRGGRSTWTRSRHLNDALERPVSLRLALMGCDKVTDTVVG